MTSNIEEFFQTSSSAEVNSAEFRAVLEDHMTYLRNLASTRVEEVSAHDAHVYAFDWIGLLKKLRIPTELHWVVIRLNEGRSYTDLPEDTRSLYIPEQSEINKLLQLHLGARRQK